MTTVNEKLVLEIATKNFSGATTELQELGSQVTRVSSALKNAFSSKAGGQALTEFTGKSVELGESLKKLTNISAELGGKLGAIVGGQSLPEIAKYESAIRGTIKQTQDLKAALIAAAPSPAAAGAISRAFNKPIREAMQALRDLQKLSAAAQPNKASQVSFLEGQVNAKEERVRADGVNKVTESLARQAKAAQDVQTVFRSMASSGSLGAAETQRALDLLAKAMGKVTSTAGEQLVMGKRIEEQLLAEAAATDTLVAAKNRDIAAKAQLQKSSSFGALTSQVSGATPADRSAALAAVNKRIESGELKTALQVQQAITSELSAQVALKKSGSVAQRVATNATIEDKKQHADILRYLTEEASKSGLLLKLKGDLRSVLSQTVSESKALGYSVSSNVTQMKELLALNAETKVIERSGAPKQLNEFGIAFIAGFASQALFASIGKVINQLSAFEDSLTNVRRTANATLDTSRALGQEILKIGQEVPVAATSLAEAATALGQIGTFDFKNEEMRAGSAEFDKATKAIRLVAETSSIAELDINTVAIAYGQLSLVFEKDVERIVQSLKDAGNGSADTTDGMRVLLGAVNEVGNRTAATSQDILQFSQRFGGLGSSLGISAENIIALGGAVRDFGVNTEVAGTAFTRFFSRASEDADEFGKALGVSAEVFRSRFARDALGTVLSTLKVLKSQTAQNAFALEDFFGKLNLESREKNAFTKIAQNVDAVTSRLEYAADLQKNYSSGSDEAAKRTETWSAQVTKLGNSMLSLYSALQPIVDVAGRLVGWLAKLVYSFANLGLAPVIAGVVGLSAVVAAFSFRIISLYSQIRLLVESMRSMHLQALEASKGLNAASVSAGRFGTTMAGGLKVGAALAAITLLTSAIAAAGSTMADSGDKAGKSFIGGLYAALTDTGVLLTVGAGLAVTLVGSLVTAVAPLILNFVTATLLPGVISGLATIGGAVSAFVFGLPGLILAGLSVALVAGLALVSDQIQVALKETMTSLKASSDSSAETEELARQYKARNAAFAAHQVSIKATIDAIGSLAAADKELSQQLLTTSNSARTAASDKLSYAQALAAVNDKTTSSAKLTEALTVIERKQEDLRQEASINSNRRSQEAADGLTALAARLNSSGIVVAIQNLAPSAAATAVIDAASVKVNDLTQKLAALRAERAKSRASGDSSGVSAATDDIGATQGELKSLQKKIEAAKAILAAFNTGEAAAAKAVAEANKVLIEDAANGAESLGEKLGKGRQAFAAAWAGVKADINKFSQDDPFSDVFDSLNSARISIIEKMRVATDAAVRDAGISADDAQAHILEQSQYLNSKFLKTLGVKFADQARNAVKTMFSGLTTALRQNFAQSKIIRDFERLPELIKTESIKKEIQALDETIENFGRNKKYVDEAAEGWKGLEDVISSSLGAAGTKNEEFSKKSKSALETFRSAVDKLAGAFKGLKRDSKEAYDQAKLAAEAATKSAKASAFQGGLAAGKTFAADSADKKKSDSLAGTGIGRDIIQKINAITQNPKGGNLQERGAAAGNFLGETAAQLDKQGLTEQFAPLMADLEKQLQAMFTPDAGKSPQDLLRETLTNIGTKTNELLNGILKVLGGEDPGAKTKVTDSESAKADSRATQKKIDAANLDKDGKQQVLNQQDKLVTAADARSALQEQVATAVADFAETQISNLFAPGSTLTTKAVDNAAKILNAAFDNLDSLGHDTRSGALGDARFNAESKLSSVRTAASVVGREATETVGTGNLHEATSAVEVLRAALISRDAEQRTFNSVLVTNVNEVLIALGKPLLSTK